MKFEVMEDNTIIMAVIGIVGGLMTFLQKVLYGQNKDNYSIICDLIKRINKSDDRLEEIADSIGDSAERRHEKMNDSLNRITDELNFMKGRMNGGGK